MGSIPEAMARSLAASGVKIRCGAEVVAILADDHGVRGVALATGEEVYAKYVLSNLNPKTTLLNLLDADLLEDDVHHRVTSLPMRGSAFKIGLALDAMPRFAAAKDESEANHFAQCQFRIGPSMEYMDRAFTDANNGMPSAGPMFWGLTPSVTDPNLAPPGKHLMSINIFHAPYTLADGNWDEEKDRFGKRCIDILTDYIPNLKNIIVDHRFWSPKDLEREYGLLEANITHGDMLPGRMFSLRPVPGIANYQTPVRGLYLCGSGVWPGGFVSGLPGHNASHKVLSDIERDNR
jgi:phytoene dehydrogenase-like protein